MSSHKTTSGNALFIACALTFVAAAAKAEEVHTKEIQAANQQVQEIKAESKQLERYRQPPPITGFHPIKKITQPLKNLEDTADKLNRDATKLEKPLATIQTPMLSLQHGMNDVDTKLGVIHGEIGGTQNQVKGAREDIAKMRKDIESLREPVTSLQKPMEGVAGPLVALRKQLNFILFALFVATIGIAFGVPATFMIMYRYREKFFPGLHHELKRHGLTRDMTQ